MEEKDVKVIHHSNAGSNNKLWIMAMVLGLLIIMTGVQTIELVSLKDKLSSEVLTLIGSGSAPTISTGQSSGSLSANLQNLPTMVGGC